MQLRARLFSLFGKWNGMESGFGSVTADKRRVPACVSVFVYFYLFAVGRVGGVNDVLNLKTAIEKESERERERERRIDDWASMSFELVAFIILWPSDCGKSSFNIFEWGSKKVRPQQHAPPNHLTKKESAAKRNVERTLQIDIGWLVAVQIAST